MSVKDDKKNFCYLDKCVAVMTGFQWNDILACSYCKQELSPALYKIIKDRQEKKDKKDKVDDDTYTFWDSN